jgi:hypothetical protein
MTTAESTASRSTPPRFTARLRTLWGAGSGPLVARLFQCLLALIFLDAWISLGVQIRVLLGQRGLLPVAPLFEAVRAQKNIGFGELPSLLWWWTSDAALFAHVGAGIVLALLALFNLRPRLCFLLSTALYLSIAVAARTFLSFQWDNLLLECGLLAALLPTDRPAPLRHLLFRLLLFKLYFESGLAKWYSPLHDWQDGSAMTYYYETAPLPTALAWYAHHAPISWHHVESWATLALELGVPFLLFGPRLARRVAFVVFTGFQIVNAATANYGFFCHLALALHVFLLDDEDLRRVRHWWAVRRGWSLPGARASLPGASPNLGRARWRVRLSRGLSVLALIVYGGISLVEGYAQFSRAGGKDQGEHTWLDRLDPVRARYQPLRLVNNYHLFAAITRERIEPEFQTRTGDAGAEWVAHHLHHKPGDPLRRPDWAAPHQPRVDFQLWFHGLSFRRNTPAYVATLVDRLCHDPAAVAELFTAPLPPAPTAVRIAYWQYHFTTADERQKSGAWWNRELFATIRPIECHPTKE